MTGTCSHLNYRFRPILDGRKYQFVVLAFRIAVPESAGLPEVAVPPVPLAVFGVAVTAMEPRASPWSEVAVDTVVAVPAQVAPPMAMLLPLTSLASAVKPWPAAVISALSAASAAPGSPFRCRLRSPSIAHWQRLLHGDPCPSGRCGRSSLRLRDRRAVVRAGSRQSQRSASGGDTNAIGRRVGLTASRPDLRLRRSRPAKPYVARHIVSQRAPLVSVSSTGSLWKHVAHYASRPRLHVASEVCLARRIYRLRWSSRRRSRTSFDRGVFEELE